MKTPSVTSWVGWFGATLLAALTMTAGAFSTFQTKDEAKDTKSDIVKSLDEIKSSVHEMNQKLDEIKNQ